VCADSERDRKQRSRERERERERERQSSSPITNKKQKEGFPHEKSGLLFSGQGENLSQKLGVCLKLSIK